MRVTVSSSHGRTANRKRLLRLSLLLAGAAIGTGFATGAGAQTLDLNGAVVTLPDLDAAPGDQYEIVENGVLRLDPVPPLTYNGLLQDGTGFLGVEKLNNSNLILGGNNTYTGGTNVLGGTLTLAHNNAAGTGTISLASFAHLAAGAPTLTISNAVQTTGVATIDTGSSVFTINSVVSGTGSITVGGNGNLVLNGVNSFDGGLTVNHATVTLGTDTAAGNGTIGLLSNATLAAGAPGLTIANDIVIIDASRIDAGSGTFTLNGTIIGNGPLTMIGTGNLVLNGNNSFDGGLIIAGGPILAGLNGGTVTLGTDTAAGTGTITMGNGTTLAAGVSGLVLENGFDLQGAAQINQGAGVMTLNGGIGGLGAIYTGGTGNLVLNGNNSFAGGLNVSGGIVTLGNNNAAGTGQIALSNSTLISGLTFLELSNNIAVSGSNTIVVAGSGNITLNGAISGTGSIKSVGSVALLLKGNNSFSGGLDIASGNTVLLDNNNAAGTGTISLHTDSVLGAMRSGLAIGNAIVTDGSARISPGSGNFTLNGEVSGAGSITVTGGGNLILNGDNSYAGGTTMLGGGLTLGSNTAAGTGTIHFAGNAGFAAGAPDLVIANAIQTDAFTNIDSGPGSFTLNGDISGAGGIRQLGTGNLVLNGNNSFVGLGISGGRVTLGTDTAAGTGDIFVNNGTLAAGVTGLVVTNAVHANGATFLDSGAGSFLLIGDIDGVGSVGSIGSGRLTLRGNNSFSGGLDIAASSRVYLGSNTAAGTGTISLHNASLLAADMPGLVIGNAILTDGFAFVNAGLGDFTLNGVISGSGSINQISVGNLVLDGDNSFSGGLGILNGTVTLGTNTAAGTGTILITDQATLAAGLPAMVLANDVQVDGDASVMGGLGGLTLNGTISGAGSLTSQSLGNLILGGNNSFSGGLVIDGGLSALGSNTSVVILGANTAAGTGTITINDLRTLAAGAPGLVLANAINTPGDANIDAGTGTMTLNGTISGGGAIVKYGSGTLVLNGNNSFANGLGISAGTVVLGSNTAAGTGQISFLGDHMLAAGASGLVVTNAVRTNGAARIDSGSGTFTMTGTISGSGSITKLGGGTLVLGGISSFTGPTTVGNGRLIVTGTLGPSAVTVNATATLGGTGTISSVNALNGAFVAPGGVPGGIGTLTVTGNATFQSGSTFQVDLSGGSADRLTVGGVAALNGANLTVTPGGQPLLFNTSYTILTATGGRTGSFSTGPLMQFGPQFAPTVTYGTNDVVLKLVPNSLIVLLGASASSGNIRNRAAAFDAATSAGFNPQDYFNLFGLGAAMAQAVNQLTGEIHSIEARTAIADTRHTRDAVLDRLGGGTGGDHRYGIWGRAIGSWGKTSGDGNGASVDIDTKGLVTGFDLSFEDWTLGANFAALRTQVDTAGLGNGKVESIGGGLYGGYRADQGFAAALGGSVSGVTSRSTRTTAIPSIVQTLTANTNGISYQAFGDVSFDLAAGTAARIEPFARFAYVAYHVDGINESGGFAAVNGRKTRYETTIVTAGIRGGTPVGGVAMVHGSLGYQRIGGDRAAITGLSLLGTNSPAAIGAVPLDKDAFAGTFGVDFRLSRAATIGFGYSGVIGKNNSDHSANASLTIGF